MATSSPRRFAIGVDFGTNSVRALIVDTANGSEVASHVSNYPSGTDGILLDSKDPNLARQNPADYIEGFYSSVKRAVVAAKRKRGFKVDLRDPYSFYLGCVQLVVSERGEFIGVADPRRDGTAAGP